MNNIKLDLHTHSILSPDGGLSEQDYKNILEQKVLDCVAITDHDAIAFAQKMHKKLGEAIIIGEEITTTDGEIIGLFLSDKIESGLSAKETAQLIRKQHGIVIIPHPFETVRQGIKESVLHDMIELVDCIEVFNGRSLQPQTRKLARKFVKDYALAPVSSSDSHCRFGIGRTYSMIAEMPEKKNLKDLLERGSLEETPAPWWTFVCPKMNRLRKIVFGLACRQVGH